MGLGQPLFIEGAGVMEVASISGLNVTLSNPGQSENAQPGLIIALGKKVSPGGIGGNSGNAYTNTTAAFVMPAALNTVQVSFINTAFMVAGEPIFISNAGTFIVSSIQSGVLATIVNTGQAENVAPATNVPGGQGVTPTGFKGNTGATGIATLNGISPTTTKGDLIADNGANSPNANDVRLAVGTNGQVLAADDTQPTGLGYKTVQPNSVANDRNIAIYDGTTGRPVPLKDSKMLISTTGALQSTPSGGNARGASAVDLQVVRVGNPQVASGTQSVIGGGFANLASGVLSVVSGGTLNTASGDESTVGGGGGNFATANGTTIAGGTGNAATVLYAAIGGGNANVASAQGATVPGGETNTASGTDSAALGGTHNLASGTNSVALGAYAKADKYSQVAIGSDAATTQGAVQYSILLPIAATVDATPTPMVLNIAGSNRMTIPNNTIWGVYANVVAKVVGSPNLCAVWKVEAAVKNFGGTVTVMAATVTAIAIDGGFPGPPTLAVVADNVNVAMQFTVTGFAATGISWFGAVRITELFSN